MKEEKLTLLEQARRDKPMIAARMREILKEFGIEGEPIPARELQAMIKAEGILEENELSRGIIEMREE